MNLTKEQQTKIEELSKAEGLEMDLQYHIENSDAETIDELTDYLEDQGAFNIEIIYYATAMEYLLENDPSLSFSLEIAHDMGYELENLNSETLASLLASQNERELYQTATDDLEAILFPDEGEDTNK